MIPQLNGVSNEQMLVFIEGSPEHEGNDGSMSKTSFADACGSSTR